MVLASSISGTGINNNNFCWWWRRWCSTRSNGDGKCLVVLVVELVRKVSILVIILEVLVTANQG
jgi:hypothetical protein